MFYYPCLTEALDIIERLHHHKTKYAYSGLFTGLSGRGKTYLAKHYQPQYPIHFNREKTSQPVIYCRLKAPITNIGLLEQLIKSLGAPIYKRSSIAVELEERLISLFIEHKVQLAIVDEVQECLTTVDGINAQRMAKRFASILNSAKRPFTLLGTPSATRLLNLKYGTPTSNLSGEEQLSRRFIS
jgi:type II secretory pathway predicted ATPase ExeA